jgi:hypothetical protein
MTGAQACYLQLDLLSVAAWALKSLLWAEMLLM